VSSHAGSLGLHWVHLNRMKVTKVVFHFSKFMRARDRGGVETVSVVARYVVPRPVENVAGVVAGTAQVVHQNVAGAQSTVLVKDAKARMG